MEASKAAQIFHDWAAGEGLMPGGPTAPLQATPAELALVQPVRDRGRLLLRAKQVQSVGFNNEQSEIIVFTKRVAPSSKRQLAELPAAIDDVQIRYRQGVQNPIGEPPSAAHGGPAFVIRNVAGQNYYACGGSISVGNAREGGTMGCLVAFCSALLRASSAFWRADSGNGCA
jgi:hypothetical protein